MNPLRWLAGFALLALVILFAFPNSGMADEGAETVKATYLVSSPHTPEECLAALDEFAAGGEESLDNWYWGCKDGDHTGYEIIQAGSKEEALSTVPESLRDKAKATEVGQITAEDIAAFHKSK